MRKLALFIIILCVAAVPNLMMAGVGVGVGLGKLKSRKNCLRIYKLNSIPILNTGDEAGTYEVAVTFMADQKESRPEEDWFIFEPKTFELNRRIKISGGDSDSSNEYQAGAYFAF